MRRVWIPLASLVFAAGCTSAPEDHVPGAGDDTQLGSGDDGRTGGNDEGAGIYQHGGQGFTGNGEWSFNEDSWHDYRGHGEGEGYGEEGEGEGYGEEGEGYGEEGEGYGEEGEGYGEEGEPGVSCYEVAGNPTCEGLELGVELMRIDPPHDGTYYAGDMAVTISTADGLLDFESNVGVDAVILKAGPGARVCSFDTEAWSARDLECSENRRNGERYDLSHVDFCRW